MCIEVRDNGLGIPRSEQRELFTRFFRSTTAQENAIQGTGLGLTIVDSIVKSHGGEIAVESAHLEGSTFTVTLPLAGDAHPVPEQRGQSTMGTGRTATAQDERIPS
jgi:signal transduction histidine kinase